MKRIQKTIKIRQKKGEIKKCQRCGGKITNFLAKIEITEYGPRKKYQKRYCYICEDCLNEI